MEAKERGETPDDGTPSADLAEPPNDLFDPTDESGKDEPIDDFKDMNRLIELDQEWRDHFASTNIPMRDSRDEDEKRQFMLDSVTSGRRCRSFYWSRRVVGFGRWTDEGGRIDHRQHR